MAEIEIRPNAVGGMEVKFNGKITDFGIGDGMAMMESLATQAKGHIEVSFSAYGRKMGQELTNKALDLAGLSGLGAAKAKAAGKINL